jgi:hypothetical protein
MADKADKAKKTVSISIKRERLAPPKIIITTGFKLRLDKATGLLDVYLEASSGQKGERVGLDPNILASNVEMLRRYAAGLAVEQDDAAQKEDISVSEQTHFANVMHCSNMGTRSETIFGVFSIADWVEATRSETTKKPEVTSVDSVVAISTPALQKKLVLEVILQVSQSKE